MAPAPPPPPAFLHPLLRCKALLLVVGAPLAFLPLPLLLPTQEARCGYVIILMAVYWCTEVIPLAVTALLPVVLFPMFGILESKKVPVASSFLCCFPALALTSLSGLPVGEEEELRGPPSPPPSPIGKLERKVCVQYLKDTNMLFVGGLIIAVAVEHWSLHKRIALRVLLIVGVKPALLMLGFMGVTASLSMWISNTATTAMMVPIVQAVLDQMDSSEKEVAVAVAEAGAGRHVNAGIELEGKNAADPSTVQVIGNGYVCDSSREQAVEDKKRVSKGMTLSVCYAASIGGTATLTGTGPNLVLKGQMNQLFPENGDILNFASWFGFAFPNMLLMLLLAWFWLQFSFLGFNFRRTWGCDAQKTEKEKAILGVLKEEHRKLGPVSFAEFNVMMVFTLLVLLWFTRDPGFIPGWATYLFNQDKEYVTDATVAIFVALLLFIIPAHKPRGGFCCSQSSCDLEEAAEAMKEPGFPAPLLDWRVVQQKMPWNIVLLLGGGFALANGSDVSGLSKWLGNQMSPLHSVPPWAIAMILSLVIAVFTECTSNVATATLFLPVFASLSQSIEVNPLYIMIPCTLSASFAFMLPVATPPNAIVFSYGHLHVSDMAKTGIVMNIIGILCISLAVNSWGQAMFHLDTFPSWANATVGK